METTVTRTSTDDLIKDLNALVDKTYRTGYQRGLQAERLIRNTILNKTRLTYLLIGAGSGQLVVLIAKAWWPI